AAASGAVVPGTTKLPVLAGPAAEAVIANTAVKEIIAAKTIEGVVAAIAEQPVLSFRAVGGLVGVATGKEVADHGGRGRGHVLRGSLIVDVSGDHPELAIDLPLRRREILVGVAD